MADLDIRGFVRRVLEMMSEGCDIDVGCIEEAAIKYGIYDIRPAIEEDVKEGWAQEYGIEIGDEIAVRTEALKAYLNDDPPPMGAPR